MSEKILHTYKMKKPRTPSSRQNKLAKALEDLYAVYAQKNFAHQIGLPYNANVYARNLRAAAEKVRKLMN